MKVIPLSGDTIQLDSVTLVPGSVIIINPATGTQFSDSLYTVDIVNGTLVWLNKPAVDTVKLVYRTLAVDLNKPLFNKEPSLLQTQQDFVVNPYSYSPSSQTTVGVIDFGNLEYSGSFARGLSFGNSQNVVLNSSFNLQIAGFITEDIEIVAALTDNNIPIQPDGSTQQLQEFDRVFIQINKQPHRLIVGDYEIGAPQGHFMQFYKNLQGASYSGYFQIKDSLRYYNSTSLAIAKGRFSRNQLNITEGNQGPYKLTGANGETFIIILAGTERVFVNGRQLVRGSENDYIIDYNLGEITFTPNQIITEDLRVFVEFEYSEQNYFRSFIHTNNVVEHKWGRMRVGFYNEQDNKNQSIQGDLTDEQKTFLTNTGETVLETQFPGYREVDYDATRVLYQLIDTTVGATSYDTVFVYSTNPQTATYNLTFAFLGQNKGNYKPANTTANGRVFQWVAPENGIPQGSYEPVITLVTPKRRQMTVVGLDFTPTKNDLIVTEVALSNDDLNTFSEIGDNDNIGFAGKGAYTKNIGFGKLVDSKKAWHIKTNLDYEFVNHNFTPLDRFRPVEFVRNWNYTPGLVETDQHLAQSSITFSRTNWASLSYEFATLQDVQAFQAYKHTVSGSLNNKGYKLDFTTSVLNTEGFGKSSQFIRPLVTAEKTFNKLKGWRIGGRYEHDNNKQHDAVSDELLPESFVFTDWRVYIAAPVNDSVKNKLKLEYIRRLEWRPLYGNDYLRLFTKSNTWNLSGEWVSNKVHNLSWMATYRRFENLDSTRTSSTDLEEYYLARVQYGLNVLKGAITSSILYELGAGQEQRREYTYVPVNSGDGNFIWIDYNQNGLQEQNEFELATFTEDTMFIRVLNPTNEFDPVNITVFNQVLNLNPSASIRTKDGFVGFVARFKSITSLQIDRRSFRGSNISTFNPFLFDITDNDLIATNSTIRQTVFFNRSSTKFSMEYTFQDNRSKTNYNNGFESRKLQEHLMRPRVKLLKSVNLVTKVIVGNRSNISEFFTERNYQLMYYEIEPELSYLFKSKFRVSGAYQLIISDNVLAGSGLESATINKFTIRSKYSLLSKGSFQIEVSYASIDYTGEINSPVEFAMLQGLKAGNNYLWNAGFSRTVGKNIQLNLTYEGRKTGSANMIHIGRAQIRAIF